METRVATTKVSPVGLAVSAEEIPSRDHRVIPWSQPLSSTVQPQRAQGEAAGKETGSDLKDEEEDNKSANRFTGVG